MTDVPRKHLYGVHSYTTVMACVVVVGLRCTGVKAVPAPGGWRRAEVFFSTVLVTL